MDNTVIVALVSGLCVSIPSVIATISSNNKAQALIDYRINQLDKKVEKHNDVIKRTYQLEEDVKLIKQKVDFYHHD